MDTPEPITILEDEVFYFDLSLISPMDIDNDPLYWYLENRTSLIGSVAILENGSLRITPLADGFGEGEFVLRVQDGRGGVAYTTFRITIEPLNDPPTFMAPQGWTQDVELGGSREIDLRFTPYFVEDVDDGLETLTAQSDYGLKEVEGLVLTLSVPPDTASDTISVLVWVSDPKGYDSTIHELTLNIVEDMDPGNGWIEINNLTISNPNGDVVITADGRSGQVIWVVFSDVNGIRGSYMMIESEDDPGNYRVEIDGPPWSDGDNFYIHLSSTRNGPNDSGDLPSTLLYNKGEMDDNGQDDPVIYIFFIGGLSILILLVLVIIWIIVRKNRNEISDFDYDSLLEE
jgi:hypothetical protein